MPVLAPQGQNAIVDVEKALAWSSGSPALTDAVAEFDVSALVRSRTSKYVVHVRNPSTVTALTVNCYNVETLGGVARNVLVTALTVPANSIRAFVVEGWMLGDDARVIAQNVTILGGADAFTANLTVRTM
jgi:hypothetical protein